MSEKVMKLQEAVKPRVVAILPGRFQPAAKHHKAAYEALVAKFGAKNVYIATSGVTGPKSPFTFAEKTWRNTAVRQDALGAKP